MIVCGPLHIRGPVSEMFGRSSFCGTLEQVMLAIEPAGEATFHAEVEAFARSRIAACESFSAIPHSVIATSTVGAQLLQADRFFG